MSKQINVKARKQNQWQNIGQQMMTVQYKIHIRKATRRYLETMAFDDFMHTHYSVCIIYYNTHKQIQQHLNML